MAAKSLRLRTAQTSAVTLVQRGWAIQDGVRAARPELGGVHLEACHACVKGWLSRAAPRRPALARRL